MLARATLADLLVRAEGQGDLGLIGDLQALSLRLGESGAERFLKACARAPEAMDWLGPRQGIEARLRHGFGLPLGDIDEAIARRMRRRRVRSRSAARDRRRQPGLGHRDRPAGLRRDRRLAGARWRGAGGEPRRSRRLSCSPKPGDPRKAPTGLLKAAPDYEALAARLAECCRRLLAMQRLAALVAALAAGLRAGQAFALAYADAKRGAGAVDFDDLIARAERCC